MIKKNSEQIIEEIKEVIESIRFYVNQDGGDLEFVDFNEESGAVTIKVLGACVGCSLIDLTYKDGLETILVNEVKGVTSVIITE